MTRWKLVVEYDGTAFCGWQKQLNDLTVQGILETALHSFSGEQVNIHVAGRTDAGVHALAQVAHVDLAKPTRGEIIRDALNAYLRPNRIAVLSAEQVDPAFHARFSAKSRHYRYRIVNRRVPLTYQASYAWHVIKPLRLDAMQDAAAFLLGTHDFTTFRAQDCQATSPVRTLDGLSISREGEDIFFDTYARSFLYHQVRNMVGSLTLVGHGKWTVKDFENALLAKDRTCGGPTAPPHGLYFVRVQYPKDGEPLRRVVATLSTPEASGL